MTPMNDAVDFARRLLGGRSVVVGWNGRVRAVVADRGLLSRMRGALAAPGFRWSARAARLARCLQVAAFPRAGDHLGESTLTAVLPPGSERLRPSVAFIGTPRGPRAVVVRLDDERSRPVAVCKVAVTAEAAESLDREARALDALRDTGRAPALLGTATVAGQPAIFVRFVAGRPGSTGRTALPEALAALPRAEPGARQWPAADHPWIRRVGRGTGVDTAEAIRALSGRWPEVRVHGDFAPWNLIRSADGRIVVIDWEESVPDGFIGVDLAHFVMVTAQSMRGASPATAATLAWDTLQAHLRLDRSVAITLTLLTAAATANREEANSASETDIAFWRSIVGYSAAELDTARPAAQPEWGPPSTERT
jgi:hypothetical protein